MAATTTQLGFGRPDLVQIVCLTIIFVSESSD